MRLVQAQAREAGHHLGLTLTGAEVLAKHPSLSGLFVDEDICPELPDIIIGQIFILLIQLSLLLS